MLPSLLARDIQDGLKQFLTTGFEPSDHHLHGLMTRFVARENEAQWLKGPYLQLGLPFRPGGKGRDYFSAFQTEHPGFTHQELAWQRLRTDGAHPPGNTLVATGTGSGKTECFVYPVLDHAARALAAGERGIKALVIYPMNALATDQARRLAALVASTPAFKGLRVGLFVGGVTEPGTGMVMTPTGVITDREAMRKQPPDILLTNYKMLDYLLLRPADRQLWARNTPTTLRHLVVDELHTFDGAQGTDLALLLRRLSARLKVPANYWLCVGTSATLGNSQDTTALREYARQIFNSPFSPEAVVTENRLLAGEFLGDATTDYFLPPRADFAEVLNPARYANPQEAVRAWFGVFFADEPIPSEKEVDSPAWRVRLGELLKQHLLFSNMLKRLKGDVITIEALAEQMQGKAVPAAANAHLREVIDALLVLVSWARRLASAEAASSAQTLPLVTVRVQLWLRELRRMVANVALNPADVRLQHAAQLGANPGGLHLPLVQCSECHTTGWLSRLPEGTNKLSTQLDEIYNTWFAGRPESSRLYAAEGLARAHTEGVLQSLCTGCGQLQHGNGACQACGHHELLSVFRATGRRSFTQGNAQFTRHDSTCPACGTRDRLVLLGARSATLGSQVVEHSWASPFNDDKKLIAFSDSVQDAAHRAGFFGARTYLNNVRTALAQALREQVRATGTTSLPWAEFLAALERQCTDTGGRLNLPREAFVAEFMGPNMTWQRDWTHGLLQQGVLPEGSRLPAKVLKRLLWQAYTEFTYLSHRGRTLERVGVAALALPLSLLEQVAAALTPQLREQFGAQGLTEATLLQWLWGFVTHLRQGGAVMHPELETYAQDGNIFGLLRQRARSDWLPPMGERTPRPVFLSLGQHRHFDTLAGAGMGGLRNNWYVRWAEAALGREMLLAPGLAKDLYVAAIAALETAGAIVRTSGAFGESIALAPDALQLHTDLVLLTTPAGKRHLAVPREAALALHDMPCLDATHEHYTEQAPARGWLADRFERGDLRRVIAAEHTGLLERKEREALEIRFKSKHPKAWYENLLSATPTLEMGVDIGDLSQVLLCSVPPNQASFLQRVGRAGRRDGNAMAATLADGNSPHDLYFFDATAEMLAGEVAPPGVFMRAAEVLRRQLFAYCMDDWVEGLTSQTALPAKTSTALDAVEQSNTARFPYTFADHVLKHEPRLLQGFLALIDDDLDDAVRSRLTAFVQGDGDADGLRTRLIKFLEELAEERKQYKKRKAQIDLLIQAARQRPQDEATRAEVDALLRERDKMLELIAEINGRDLLNTLTDAGLIPNYAFPEAGIELKSVLWRRRGDGEPGEGKYVALPALKYERPANSALSEFAPENRFYANQRRVEVDQINMALAKTESWRLCACCHHMQNLETSADVHVVCPRCGDAMWSDEAQKRTLLRFKQAIANSDDTKVRIDDSADDREPRFYVRQLLADFEPGDVREAWQLKTADLPFGFEFVSKVSFRDLNFGELSKPGDTFKVADVEAVRAGFKLCKHCGKVQTPQRRQRGSDAGDNDAGGEQQHSFDCRVRDSSDPRNILECLYLYREFTSEALRILVPYTRHGVDEGVVQSFMAALQLGLKRRFGGKVDHLRVVTQDEPGKDGGARRHYVMIYDSVPGGTGYLHQLLAEQAGTLGDVLTMALQAITDCPCNADPEKDGCYRCVYQYRLGRKMDLVSRGRAREVLSELVNALGQLERVKTIAEIFINPNFDSVLEARFIESLRRLGLPEAAAFSGMPQTKLVQDIVNGKSGWLLEVADQRYKVQPQCNLGAAEGVSVASKPDFVIWPWPATAAKRPIAVFCDGWAFHKDTIRQDALKRSAIVASGRFWVWSVTHDDVKAALDGKIVTDLESPLVRMNRQVGTDAAATLARAEPGAFAGNAVAQLLGWLSRPDAGAVERARKNAVWATFLMAKPPGSAEARSMEVLLTELWTTLPVWMHSSPSRSLPVLSKEGVQPQVAWRWPATLLRDDLASDAVPGLVLLDEVLSDTEQLLHLHWRHWLALFNTLQVLPGVLLMSGSGLRAGDCEALKPAVAAPPATADDGAALAAEWAAVVDQALAAVHAGLKALAATGLPPPLAGHELADERGRVVAEAELAWPQYRLVVLLPDQEDLMPAWRAAGWQVVVAARAGDGEIGVEWSETVREMTMKGTAQ
ncbi:MAG: DEAD/DEAH box helicase [Rhodoferax sp.]|nr:DEAD/DEAH box helicase [Rhodoferax sp.]